MTSLLCASSRPITLKKILAKLLMLSERDTSDSHKMAHFLRNASKVAKLSSRGLGVVCGRTDDVDVQITAKPNSCSILRMKMASSDSLVSPQV